MTQNDFDTGIGLKPEAGRPKMAYFGLPASGLESKSIESFATKITVEP